MKGDSDKSSAEVTTTKAGAEKPERKKKPHDKKKRFPTLRGKSKEGESSPPTENKKSKEEKDNKQDKHKESDQKNLEKIQKLKAEKSDKSLKEERDMMIETLENSTSQEKSDENEEKILLEEKLIDDSESMKEVSSEAEQSQEQDVDSTKKSTTQINTFVKRISRWTTRATRTKFSNTGELEQPTKKGRDREKGAHSVPAVGLQQTRSARSSSVECSKFDLIKAESAPQDDMSIKRKSGNPSKMRTFESETLPFPGISHHDINAPAVQVKGKDNKLNFIFSHNSKKMSQALQQMSIKQLKETLNLPGTAKNKKKFKNLANSDNKSLQLESLKYPVYLQYYTRDDVNKLSSAEFIKTLPNILKEFYFFSFFCFFNLFIQFSKD